MRVVPGEPPSVLPGLQFRRVLGFRKPSRMAPLLCVCGGRMKVIAFLSDPTVVKRTLDPLGLPSVAPRSLRLFPSIPARCSGKKRPGRTSTLRLCGLGRHEHQRSDRDKLPQQAKWGCGFPQAHRPGASHVAAANAMRR
jgi:hypothetical protein